MKLLNREMAEVNWAPPSNGEQRPTTKPGCQRGAGKAVGTASPRLGSGRDRGPGGGAGGGRDPAGEEVAGGPGQRVVHVGQHDLEGRHHGHRQDEPRGQGGPRSDSRPTWGTWRWACGGDCAAPPGGGGGAFLPSEPRSNRKNKKGWWANPTHCKRLVGGAGLTHHPAGCIVSGASLAQGVGAGWDARRGVVDRPACHVPQVAPECNGEQHGDWVKGELRTLKKAEPGDMVRVMKNVAESDSLSQNCKWYQKWVWSIDVMRYQAWLENLGRIEMWNHFKETLQRAKFVIT